jgi:hypothetical protein
LAHPNDPTSRPAGPVQVLPGGETITVDGSTVADPETGVPVRAAVLRLPAWRLRDLSAALRLWSTTLTFFAAEPATLPTETALATALAATADTLPT